MESCLVISGVLCRRIVPYLVYLLLFSISLQGPPIRNVAATIQEANNGQSHDKMNVIFMMADDLRAQLPMYGNPFVIAPNLERLSKKSVVFERAYCQVPVCFPSRHSLLTGLRPDTLNIHAWTDRQHPYVDSLFSMLVRDGYNSAASGKLFHHPHNSSSEFTHGRWDGEWYKYQNIEDGVLNSTVTPDAKLPINLFRDYLIASDAIDKLQAMEFARQNTGKPFILSVGFKLPHTQYHVPAEYYQKYENNAYLDSLLMLTPEENIYPPSAPSMNYRCCAKDSFIPMVNGGATLSKTRYIYHNKMRFRNEHYRELLRGYWAGISFLDSQIGRLLDELDRLDLWKSTIIVMTADHGMMLGEKGIWEKYTLWEETAKVPLMIHIPNLNGGEMKEMRFPYPVELVDVVPTLLDLLKIRWIPVKCPNSKLCFDLEGKSLLPAISASAKSEESIKLLDAFDGGENQSAKGFNPFHGYYAITQMRRCPERRRQFDEMDADLPANATYDYSKFIPWNPICNLKSRLKGSVMGYSVRTMKYRYNIWFYFSDSKMSPEFSRGIFAEELYSHIDGESDLLRDFHCEHENLIIAAKNENVPPHIKEQVEAIRLSHQKIILEFLAKKANFNFDDAMTKMRLKWGRYYELNGKGRVTKDHGLALPVNLF